MMIPFGIARRPRLYTERESRADIALLERLTDSVDRKHHASRKKSSTLIEEALRDRSFRSGRLFDWGRDGFNTKSIGWTADTQKAMLLDMSANGTWLKNINAATNASPVVYTTTAAHGFSAGDVLVTLGITGNLSANQTGLCTSPSGSNFSMTTLEGQTVAGSAAYVSGGFVIDLTQAKFVADILGNRVGTDQTLAGTSSSKGVANATSPITWAAVPAGNPAQAVIFYDAAGGSDAANRLIGWQDGKVRVVTVGNSALSATTIACQPLRAQLWDGVTGAAPVLWFSNGFSATLSAAAAQGADSLSVTALGHAIPDLQTADVISFGAGLPVTPSGGSIAFTIGSIYAPLTPTGIYEL